MCERYDSRVKKDLLSMSNLLLYLWHLLTYTLY
jgi:hypothetical protein